MAIYVPTIQTPYMLRAMFENEKWAQLVASGVIDFGVLDNYVRTGDFVNVPKFNLVADFARGDISSGDAITFTAASTTDDKAVVLRDVSGNSYAAHDVLRSGENFGALLGTSVGEKVAKRLLQQTFRMLSATIVSIDTPSANCHLQDSGNANMTIDKIRSAKRLMGDQGDALDTIVMHSKVWADLLSDAITNYKIDVVGGAVVNQGKFNGLLGIKNIIVSDLVTTANTGTGTVTDDDYDTYLLGQGAIACAFQRVPTQEVFEDITPASTLVKVKIGMDYICHLRGVKFTGSGNPSDSDFGNASNYDEAYADHREVKAVLMRTNATA